MKDQGKRWKKALSEISLTGLRVASLRSTSVFQPHFHVNNLIKFNPKSVGKVSKLTNWKVEIYYREM